MTLPVSRSRPTQPGGQPAAAPVGGAVLKATTGPLQSVPPAWLHQAAPGDLGDGLRALRDGLPEQANKRDSSGFQVGFCKAARQLRPRPGLWKRLEPEPFGKMCCLSEEVFS